MKYVEQRHPQGCIQACLSMALDIPIQDVEQKFPYPAPVHVFQIIAFGLDIGRPICPLSEDAITITPGYTDETTIPLETYLKRYNGIILINWENHAVAWNRERIFDPAKSDRRTIAPDLISYFLITV